MFFKLSQPPFHEIVVSDLLGGLVQGMSLRPAVASTAGTNELSAMHYI